MSDPFIGEIAIFANTFIPDGWLACNGQLVTVTQYQALFAVIGNRYGGDGIRNFNLPNLNGRTAIGAGTYQNHTFSLGDAVGEEAVTLTMSTIPPHTHQLSRKSPQSVSAKRATPTSACDTGVIAVAATNTPLKAMAGNMATETTLANGTISNSGAVYPAAHENRQPFLSLFFGIAYVGEFPMRP